MGIPVIPTSFGKITNSALDTVLIEYMNFESFNTTSDFTIEFFAKHEDILATSQSAFFYTFHSIDFYLRYYYNSNGGYFFIRSRRTNNQNFDISYSAGSQMEAYKWHHIAYVRYNNIIRLYLDGNKVRVQSATGNHVDSDGYGVLSNLASLKPLEHKLILFNHTSIHDNHDFRGSMTNFRISTKAVYTDNFTVPYPRLSTSQSAKQNISSLESSDVVLLINPSPDINNTVINESEYSIGITVDAGITTELDLGKSDISYVSVSNPVTVIVTVSGDPQAFYLDGSAKPAFTFVPFNTYIFDQSDASNDGNQLVFGNIPDDIHGILGRSDGVVTVGTPGQPGANTQIEIPGDFTGALAYYSYNNTEVGTTVENTYYVKVAKNILNQDVFAISTSQDGTYYNQMDLSFNAGDQAIFNVSDPSMNGQTLIFGTEIDNSASAVSSYVTVVETPGTPGALIFLNLVGYNGSTVYYFEDTSPNMGYPFVNDFGMITNNPVSTSSKDKVTIESASTSIQNLDMTIEFFLNLNTINTNNGIIFSNTDTTLSPQINMYLRFHSSGQMRTYYQNYNNRAESTYWSVPTFETNTWYHFAIVSSNETLYFYIDGIKRSVISTDGVSWASAVSDDSGIDYGITLFRNAIGKDITLFNHRNANSGYRIDGSITDFRISKKAVYTNNFTVPYPSLSISQPERTNITALESSDVFLLIKPSRSGSNTVINESEYTATITVDPEITTQFGITPSDVPELTVSTATKYIVTVSGSPEVFYLDGSPTPDVTFTRDNEVLHYIFDQSHSSNAGNQFVIGRIPDDTINILGAADGVTVVGTPGQPGAFTEVAIPTTFTGSVAYYSYNNNNLGITVENTYYVKVAKNLSNENVFAFSTTETGVYYNQMDLSFNTDYQAIFRLSDPSMNGYALVFGTIIDNSGSVVSSYMNSVGIPGTQGAFVFLNLTGYNGPPVYYFEDTLPNMGYPHLSSFGQIHNSTSRNIFVENVNTTGITGTYDYTIEFFTKFDSSTSSGYLFELRKSSPYLKFQAVYHSIGRITTYARKSDNNDEWTNWTTQTFQQDIWYHFAFVWQNRRLYFYLNGNKITVNDTMTSSYSDGYSINFPESRILPPGDTLYVFSRKAVENQITPVNCKITNFRISSKSVYTDDFTVPYPILSTSQPERQNIASLESSDVILLLNPSLEGNNEVINESQYPVTLTVNAEITTQLGITPSDVPELTVSSATKYIVTVSGSPEVFYLDGSPTPDVTFTRDNEVLHYIFDQSHISNTGHQLVIGRVPDDNSSILGTADGVTIVGVPGQPGAFTEVAIPTTFAGSLCYYSSSATTNMGTTVDNTYYMKVKTNALNEEIFAFSTTDNGVYYGQMDLSFNTGDKIMFQVSDPSMNGHTLIFGTEVDNSGSAIIPSNYTTVVGIAGTTDAFIFLNLMGYNGDAIYYFEDTTPNMGYPVKSTFFGQMTNPSTARVRIDNINTAAFAATDYTIEFYFQYDTSIPTSWSDYYYSFTGSHGFRSDRIGFGNRIFYSDNGNISFSFDAIQLHRWYHIAYVRYNNIVNIYFDGDKLPTTTTSNTIDGGYGFIDNSTTALSTTLYLFNKYTSDQSQRNFAGNMTNFRISKKAVYTGNFTVPYPTLSTSQPSQLNISQLESSDVILLINPNLYSTNNEIINESEYPVTIIRDELITTRVGLGPSDISNVALPDSSSVLYTVTVSGDPLVFYVDDYPIRHITFTNTNTYIFDQSHPSNANNRLVIGRIPDDSIGILDREEGVTVVGTPGQEGAYTEVSLPGDFTDNVSYYSFNNPRMGITIENTYYVKVVNNILNKDVFAFATTEDGTYYNQLDMSFNEEYQAIFNVSDSTMSGQTLMFGTEIDNSASTVSSYVNTVGTPGTEGALIFLNLAGYTGNTVYYFEDTSANMGYTVQSTTSNTYQVTVADSPGVFYLDGSRIPDISFSAGDIYVFDQSDYSNDGNQLVLGRTKDDISTIFGTTDSVTVVGTPGQEGAYTQITIPSDFTGSLYYYSYNTRNMGNVVDNTYYMKVVQNILNENVFAISTSENGRYKNQLDLSFNAGDQAMFIVSDPSMNGYTLVFGTIVDNNSSILNSEYVTVVGTAGLTDAFVFLNLEGYSGGTVYYFENTTTNMGFTQQPEELSIDSIAEKLYNPSITDMPTETTAPTAAYETTPTYYQREIGADADESNGFGGWIGNDENSWISLDLTAEKNVIGVLIQPRYYSQGEYTTPTDYVTAVEIHVSTDNNYWATMYHDGNSLWNTNITSLTNDPKGNPWSSTDSWRMALYFPTGPINARYVRLYPKYFNNRAGLRFGVIYDSAVGNTISDSYELTNYIGQHTVVYELLPVIKKTVTVSSTDFYLDGVHNPQLTFAASTIYIFDQSHISNAGRQLVIGPVQDNTNNLYSANDGVTIVGIPGQPGAYTKVVLPSDFTGTLYYFSLVTQLNIMYVVTVSSGKFYLNGSPNVNVTFTPGETYIFEQGDSSNSGHQILFGVIPDDTYNALGIADGVTVFGTPGQTGAYTQLEVQSNFTGSLYYYCAFHPNMGHVTIDTHYYVKTVQNIVDETVFALSTTESGTYYEQMDLSFNTGNKIVFHISDSTMNGYNLIFGTELDNSATIISSDYVTTMRTTGSTGAAIFLNLIGYDGNAVYYFEDTEANMGYAEPPENPSFTYTVTVSGSPQVFYLDGVEKQIITFTAGETYIFDQSDVSNNGHPIVFGYTKDDTINILGKSDGVTIVGTPGQTGAYTQLTLSNDFTGLLYYYCFIILT